MFTRATITIKDQKTTYQVYRHCDGYPHDGGVLDTIRKAARLTHGNTAEHMLTSLAKASEDRKQWFEVEDPSIEHDDLEWEYTIQMLSSMNAILVSHTKTSRNGDPVRKPDLIINLYAEHKQPNVPTVELPEQFVDSIVTSANERNDLRKRVAELEDTVERLTAICTGLYEVQQKNAELFKLLRPTGQPS